MSEEEEKKMRELYDQYKASRDSELDKFWKNSMYVWTFLGLCFTAYGVLIIKYIDSNNDNLKLQIAISAICNFGFALSVVWKCMAQGLKAWYEVFEIAIWDIESHHNIFNFPPNYTIGNYWYVDENKTSKPFSPSALVMSIGWCMMIFWGVVFSLNIVLPFILSPSACCSLDECCCSVFDYPIPNHHCAFVIINVVILVIDLGLWLWLKGQVKSSSLRTQTYEDKYVEIKKQLLNLKEQGILYKYLEVNSNCNGKDFIKIVFDKKYEENETVKKVVLQIKQKNEPLFEVKPEFIVS